MMESLKWNGKTWLTAMIMLVGFVGSFLFGRAVAVPINTQRISSVEQRITIIESDYYTASEASKDWSMQRELVNIELRNIYNQLELINAQLDRMSR